MKVIDVRTAKPIEIDPLIPEEKKLFTWYCSVCGQYHKATWQPIIWSMTKDGMIPIECLKKI